MSTYATGNEPFVLRRDCAALTVPAGIARVLEEGCMGYITQSLGGSFTVFAGGNLYRIAGADADALGKTPPPPLVLADDAGVDDVLALVRAQLRNGRVCRAGDAALSLTVDLSRG